VTYLQFLGQWYNLPWVAAIAVGLLLGLRRRLAGGGRPSAAARADAAPADPEDPSARDAAAREPGPRTSGSVALVVAGVIGLTVNGAIHDFRLGAIGERAPLVVPLSLAAGWVAAWGAARLRHRFAPAARGIAFNRPGLTGRGAVVLSAGLGPDGTGRARHRDEAGVVHVVRIHVERAGEDDRAARDAARPGRRVRLGEFDARRRSYPVEPL